ncbi:hypothetical protein SH1V18_31980 [Vallitalea longa]|uniref:Uncharacterized protein n=1 Tax=Vallitalea longa TaxID=2936439 RepID=A0A9W5YGE6_9FIRM|nr:hypothetical protein [Vallitalea longa]GKX30718.1 hypothetical protein SH1V18_31980 [Vallitalea longa]
MRKLSNSLLVFLLMFISLFITAFSSQVNAEPSSTSFILDSEGNPLLTGKKYYLVPAGGHLSVDNDIEKNYSRGIKKESYWFTDYPALSTNGLGDPIQVFYKGKDTVGESISSGYDVRFKFAGDDEYFDFINGNGWGWVSLDSSPDGGVAQLIKSPTTNKVFIRCAKVTRNYDGFGRMCDWYQAEKTITSYAWFDLEHLLFQSTLWLKTNFFVSPWSPGAWVFIPV